MNIQNILDEQLLKKQESRGKGSGKWKPSMLGRCYRAHYWARKNEPMSNAPDARTLRVFQAGNLFHDFVQQYIDAKDKEVKIETDNVLGFADIVTEDSVIDLKSQHSGAFHYMRKFCKDIARDKYPNWLQVCWYAMELKKEIAQLVFISKDDLCIAEYTQYTENWIDDVLCELNTLEWIWFEDKLPKARPRAYIKKDRDGNVKTDAEGNPLSKECEYCSWRSLCDGVEGK